MINANFSESQLQQLINTEITMSLYTMFHPLRRWWFHPIIMDLIEEGELGWDTAFYFPWMLVQPNNQGGNFFIQYKISKLVEGKRGREYNHWNCSYLRFKIPYPSKDKTTKKYFKDYSQYNALKKLANKGYSVYYATNHIVYKTELFELASKRMLLNNIPFMDVAPINGLHEKVTFTEQSTHFMLHSEIQEVKKVKWEQIVSMSKDKEKTNLLDDVNFLKEFIIGLEKEMDIAEDNNFTNKIKKYDRFNDMKDKTILQSFLIAKYLGIYLNCYWFRI